MNLDPIKRFRESPQAIGWADLVLTAQFQDAAQAALWQTERNLAIPADLNDAAANFFRVQGAQDLIRNLMSLTESQLPPQPKRSRELDHHA